MQAERRLHDLRDPVDLEREGDLFESGIHATRAEPTEVAACLGGDRVVGIGLRQGGEVAAATDLLEQRLGLLTRLGDGRLVGVRR